MQDNTPVYLLLIVGIVAIVGIIVMLSSGHATTQGTAATASASGAGGVTGNVVGNENIAPISFAGFSKVLFVLVVGGFAGYLYFQKHD